MEKLIVNKPVVYIVGPTASGKTSLSVEVARHFGGEIISGDSMQIYKGMHIASAAPDGSETKGVKHHMFEFLDYDEEYSVKRYVADANKIIKELHGKNILPIVVGGTGLYVTSLAENIEFSDDDGNDAVRKELENKADLNGTDCLYEYLKKIDPMSAGKISVNDKKRIIRAIEVYKTEGITMSERIKNSKNTPSPYNNIFIGLNFKDRELLYSRINKRVDLMVNAGLLEEAEYAFKLNGKTSSQAIGHKELSGFLKGEEALEEALERLKMQTRRYAKRQLTWFRKNENINWIYMDEDTSPIDSAIKIIDNKLKEASRFEK